MDKDILALADIKDRMATKTDLTGGIGRLSEQLVPIEVEVRDIRRCAEALEAAVKNISGYGKEIDHLLSRVFAIEKHLGLEQNIKA
jgi:hypothetical protein